ncbi:cathepsin O isoform X2 [Sceloporus undulatus]|uniref:cathepsin O isoform X2 n=1 Tax=Sceloporus undulatus TaxID=8520 RepID=UPI001C4D9246|nr:cathepsin O isoform X2 [Sceloporus undulatus]
MKALWLVCWLLSSSWALSLLRNNGATPEPPAARKGPPPSCDSGAARRESIKRIRHLNSFSTSDNNTAFYGINQFSNLFPQEFKAIYLQSKPSKVPKYTPGDGLEGTEKPLPAKFDWRDKDVVTQVRNQGTCGGCWAFSVVGIVESVYAIKRKFLEELSVQQVIDCSYNNSGCHGGSTVTALSWLNQTRVKLVRDSEYPFKAQMGLCHYFTRADFGVSVKGYAAYDLSDQEDKMKKMLIEWGPLAVIVDAVSWQDYLGGIIQHHCSSGEPNHAVLITGYDTTGSIPFWIVRNSWGPTWGLEGYVHIKMGSNICGIADEVSAVFI